MASLKQEIRDMKVGEILAFDASRMGVVKTTVFNVSFEMDRKYKTSCDRKNRTITVRRDS